MIRHLLDAVGELTQASWKLVWADFVEFASRQRCFSDSSRSIPRDYACISKLLIDYELNDMNSAAIQKANHLRSPSPLMKSILDAASDVTVEEANDGGHELLLSAALSGDYENFMLLLERIARMDKSIRE